MPNPAAVRREKTCDGDTKMSMKSSQTLGGFGAVVEDIYDWPLGGR
jgi:hypothetical protein